MYDSFDEIDFDALPDRFVMKCNHDCGSVTLVSDKNKLDMKALKRKYDFYLKRNYAWMGFEMHYRNIKSRIIIEQYMGDSINDYKFLCFDGRPYYCWVDFDRYSNHSRIIYNMEWERQPFTFNYPSNLNGIEAPQKFDEMRNIAANLCINFPHVRVDMYFVNEHIYFGEMTFSNANGFGKFTPYEWNYKLGELWPFDNTVRRKIISERTHP